MGGAGADLKEVGWGGGRGGLLQKRCQPALHGRPSLRPAIGCITQRGQVAPAPARPGCPPPPPPRIQVGYLSSARPTPTHPPVHLQGARVAPPRVVHRKHAVRVGARTVQQVRLHVKVLNQHVAAERCAGVAPAAGRL